MDYRTNDAERATQLESLIDPASAIEHPSSEHLMLKQQLMFHETKIFFFALIEEQQ